MEELFSKTTAANVLLQGQEFFELGLDDLGTPVLPQFIDSVGAIIRHRFLVQEAHAAWSESGRKIMWDGFEHDECSTLEKAEVRYKERRAAIVEKGFVLTYGCTSILSAKTRHEKETPPIPRVEYAERVGDDVIIEFDDGQCALYPAALLLGILPQAVKIECSASEEVESEPLLLELETWFNRNAHKVRRNAGS